MRSRERRTPARPPMGQSLLAKSTSSRWTPHSSAEEDICSVSILGPQLFGVCMKAKMICFSEQQAHESSGLVELHCPRTTREIGLLTIVYGWIYLTLAIKSVQKTPHIISKVKRDKTMNKINEKNRYNESMMGMLLFFILQTLALDKLKYLLDLPDQQRKFS